MDIFTVTLIISIVVFIAIGNYAGRNVKDLDDYYVAGRRAPTILIVGTLVASVFSATIFLGEAGFTYDGQMGPYLLFPGIAGAGYVYGALLFGRYLRRSRAPTVADYFGQRFNSRRIQQVSGLIIIVALGIYLLVVTQGAALLLTELTDLSYHQSLGVAWLSYTFFTLYAGSTGVILTDTLMFLLFAVATIAFGVYIVNDLGGVQAAIEGMTQVEEKRDIAAWHGTVGDDRYWATGWDYLIWAISIDIAWSVVYAVSPWQASRHLMARNEHVVLRAAILTCLAIIVLQIFIYGVAGLINIYNPDIDPSEIVLIWAAQNLVPDILGALLLAGIMAAALSSASTFLSLVGFSASNDILPSDKPLSLSWTRVTVLGVGLVTLAISLVFPPNIFWLTLFIGTVFTSSWGPVALMSVWSSRITANGALWGMITGFVINVVLSALEYAELITLPHYANPTIIATSISLITIIVLSRLGKVTEVERAYREKLHMTPESDKSEAATKLTLMAPIALIIYGCAIPFVMLHFYVAPYQRGTGQIMESGGINWATGEAIITLAAPLLYIPLGLLAYWMIKRDYGRVPSRSAPHQDTK